MKKSGFPAVRALARMLPPGLGPAMRALLRQAVRGAGVAAAAWALAACSPTLNWRTVQVPGAPLKALLPCDPQTAKRPVELGLGTVQMSMFGCDADYATYAISHFLVREPARAAEALSYWQAAVMGQLKSAAGDPAAGDPAAGAPNQGARLLQAQGDGAFVPPGALNIPQSLRATFEGMGPQGWKLTGHAVWFARPEAGGVRVYHAVLYADKLRPEVAETFFAGLQLQ